MSLLNNKAGVISRNANYLEFNTGNDIDVMSSQPVGSVTISQLSEGVEYSNVQAAINDVHAFSILAVNSIVVNTDGVSPEGQSQIDNWIFEGTVTNNDGTSEDCVVNVYGLHVKAKVGDNAEEFTAKVKLSIADVVSKRMAIKEYTDHSTDGNKIQVTYIDNQPHTLKSYSSNGIKIRSELVSPSKPGYGNWMRIGSQTIKFDGKDEPTILYYFKRTA